MKSTKFPEIVNQMVLRNEKLADVAKVLKLDISQISRKLSGKVEWSYKDIKSLCKHYNTKFEKLFREEE